MQAITAEGLVKVYRTRTSEVRALDGGPHLRRLLRRYSRHPLMFRLREHHERPASPGHAVPHGRWEATSHV